MPFVQTHLTSQEFQALKWLAIRRGVTLKDLLANIIRAELESYRSSLTTLESPAKQSPNISKENTHA